METDLFKTKEQQLYEILVGLKQFSSVDVRRIGLQLYYTRADRTVREWAEEGKIKRITTEQAKWRNLIKDGNANIAWYEI